MRLDVLLTAAELVPADLAGRTVVVIDVLRATSTIVQALAAGARSIYPVASVEEALRLGNTLGRDEVLLCGERKSLPIEGFDLGNSPAEFTPERVAGRVLVMSTTNGTAALAAAAGAERVLVGAWLNLSAVTAELVASAADPVLLCAGRERTFGLDDAVLAGKIAARVLDGRPRQEWEMNDGGLAALSLARTHTHLPALLRATAAGRALAEVGLGGDVEYCARVDLHGVVPVLHDRQIAVTPASTPRPQPDSQ